MAQYIDKAALVAEIEKYISNYKGILNKIDKSSDEWVTSTLMLESKIDVLQHILSFLNTLEVKDEGFKPMDSDFGRDAVSFCFDNGLNTTPYIAKTIAKHFYELGLKADKQFEKERLDKMYEWLKDNIKDYVFVHSYSSNVNIDIDTLVEDLQKSMEKKV